MNRSRLSSPVPFQKTVPLDIVPNNIVSSLLVQKTYSAQYPGDFSGGIVDIRTRTKADEDYLNLKLSIGGNSESTGGDGIYYRGGHDDNWGTDDGTRAIPRNVAKLSSEEYNAADYPDSAALGASFYNKWDIYEKDVKPLYNGELEFGKNFEFGNEMVLGILGSVKYRNIWLNTIKDMRRYEFTGVDGGSNQTVDYERWITRQQINISGFLNIGLEIDENNSVAFTAVGLRQSEDEVQQDRGLSSEDNVANGVPVESYRLQWTENEVESFQLSGEHYFPSFNDSLFEWRIVDGGGSREAPDTRTYTYAEDNSGNMAMVTSSRQAAGDLREVYRAPDRNYSELEDDTSEYGFDVEIPISWLDSTIRVGWSDYERERESEDRLFRFDLSPLSPEWIAWQTPRQFFSIENWTDEYLTSRDFSSGAANASGIFPFASSSEEVTGYYGSIDSQNTADPAPAVGPAQGGHDPQGRRLGWQYRGGRRQRHQAGLRRHAAGSFRHLGIRREHAAAGRLVRDGEPSQPAGNHRLDDSQSRRPEPVPRQRVPGTCRPDQLRPALGVVFRCGGRNVRGTVLQGLRKPH